MRKSHNDITVHSTVVARFDEGLNLSITRKIKKENVTQCFPISDRKVVKVAKLLSKIWNE